MKLRSVLQSRDPRVWALIIIVVVGFAFSIYKMVEAFSPQSQPAYATTPPSAFASTPPLELINPDDVNNPRLPDVAYKAIYASMRQVVPQIASLTATKSSLEAAGMDPSESGQALQSINALQTDLDGGTGEASPDYSVGTVSQDAAQMTATINYNVNGQLLPATVQFEYVTSNGATWTLDGLKISSGVISGGE